VSQKRREENRRFAELLRAWTESGSSADDLLLVEEVIPRIVLPLLEAKQNVLILLIDGMSWPVALEVLDDPRLAVRMQTAWPQGAPGPIPVIATIPCVTEHSRMSLLSGELSNGSQADEKRSFAAHSGLLASCGKKSPPVVFHKAEVTESARGPAAEVVLEAIRSREKKVVGVVLNAVDERLSNAQQVRDRWTLDSIRPLAALLQAACDGDRVVVVASDHGHVLHRPGENVSFPDSGERWRAADAEVRDGEVLVRGSRVHGPGGARALVLAWEEGLRYGAHKNGYHGGATPQEMIAPLVVLAPRDRTPEVLTPCDIPQPDWWSGGTPRAAVQPAHIPARPVPEETVQKEFANLPIFSQAAPRAPQAQRRGAWLENIFLCEAYRAQRELVRKHAPPDDQIRRALEILEAHGGALTPTVLAQKLGLLSARLDGFLAKLQRVLNIDGYEVLFLDRSRDVVELNVSLLLKQFDLE
jgi:hypothetical protein